MKFVRICGIIDLPVLQRVPVCRKKIKPTKEKEWYFMEKKREFSLLRAFITVICLISIALSVTLNVLFSNDKVPKILGRYIYIVEKGADYGGDITPGAALIAKDAKGETIENNFIVLCYPTESPDTLCIRKVTADEGGFKTSELTSSVSTGPITQDKIIAVCSGYPESKELGALVRFAISIKGILICLLLPCVILVILLIVRIASSKSRDSEDENYIFYEYDEEEKNKPQPTSHVKSSNPLFEASQEIQPSNELERKKMSIAENFSQKKVNQDSPYQREKERTMQFKAQRSAESSFAAKNMGGSSSTAPTADALREEMLRKTAEAERTGTFNIRTNTGDNSVPDNTGVLSKAQLAEMSRNDVPRTTPLRSQSSQPSVQKKSSSPDITDIIKRSDSEAKKKSAADMSVDDLLKLIESEKSKL